MEPDDRRVARGARSRARRSSRRSCRCTRATRRPLSRPAPESSTSRCCAGRARRCSPWRRVARWRPARPAVRDAGPPVDARRSSRSATARCPSTSRRSSWRATASGSRRTGARRRPEDAAGRRRELGFPVVVKVDGEAHKSRGRRRRPRRRDPGSRGRRCAAGSAARCSSRVRLPPGAEAFCGMTRDPAVRAGARRRPRRRRTSRPSARSPSRVAPLDRETALELVAEAGLDRAGGRARGHARRALTRCHRPPGDRRDRRQSPDPGRRRRDSGRRPRRRRPRRKRMTEEAVLYERRGPAAWITLNRPEKLNALNRAIVAGLGRVDAPRPSPTTRSRPSSSPAPAARSRPGTTSARRSADRIESADDWHAVLRPGRRRDDGALEPAEADDRRRARLVPGRAPASSRWPAT